jgi:hypothetical protein
LISRIKTVDNRLKKPVIDTVIYNKKASRKRPFSGLL